MYEASLPDESTVDAAAAATNSSLLMNDDSEEGEERTGISVTPDVPNARFLSRGAIASSPGGPFPSSFQYNSHHQPLIPNTRPTRESVLQRLSEALLRRSLTKVRLSVCVCLSWRENCFLVSPFGRI